MNGQSRNSITIGAKVDIVLKADQRSGKLTNGTVQKILTKSSFHPHGIKVQLQMDMLVELKKFIKKVWNN